MNYVILAGGTGTRLWPMSRDNRPKQLTSIISELTMLEETLKRLEVADGYANVYISTRESFATIISEILPDFPTNHFIIDPEKRDTGPAMALVAAIVAQDAPDEPVAFIPSDAYIRDVKLFRKTLRAAEKMIGKTGKMVNIGIVPAFPNPQLGHIKIGESIENDGDIHFFGFEGFVEKPEYKLAKKYMESDEYLWNANFYMWTPNKFIDVYKTYAPEIGEKIEAVAAAVTAGKKDEALKLYQELPKISIDYAVSEKMDRGLMIVIRGEFGWSDIGSWEQLYEQLKDATDEEGNLVRGEWAGVDTQSSLIYGEKNKIIATIGLSDMIVVDTPDALLICPMGRAQDVKKVVALLQEQDKKQYL